MGREQTANHGDHIAAQTNGAADWQRVARELGQLVGKYLADQHPNGIDRTGRAARRPGVDVGSKIGTIIQTGQIGETVIGHSNHRHEDRVVGSKNPLRLGPSDAARHAD